MMKTDFETRERLRQDLPTIRSLAGWSAERLSDLLDVSRTTVVTLENSSGKMTVIQYLAIRALLSAAVAESGNALLEQAISLFVDQENTPESEKNEIRQTVALAAKKVGRKAGIAAVQRETMKAIGELRLSEIPPETIQRGKELVEELLSQKNKTISD